MTAEMAVLCGFIGFVVILLFARVPSKVAGMLDGRADRIRAQIDEARLAKEEAQKVLASIERKQQEMQVEADSIVERAKTEAQTAYDQAIADLEKSTARKLKAAEERIAQAEASATREVRNAAAAAAAAAAQAVLAQDVSGDRAASLIDDGIASVGRQLN